MLAAMEVGIPKKGRAWGGKIAYPADDDDGEDKNGFVNREDCGVYVADVMSVKRTGNGGEHSA
jgi:hypothetical protein